MKWSTKTERSNPSLVGHLQLILTLTSWIVGLAVVLFTNWVSIPVWAQYVIISFIGASFLVTLVLGIIPSSRLLKAWVDSVKKERQQRRSLMQLADLVQEARMLFELHASNSLRNYVNSLCNAVAQDRTLHPQIKQLDERLHILADWHWSLLTFANTGFRQKGPYARIVRDVTMFYRDTADVVRELAGAKLPEDGSVKAYDDQQRMIKDKYNQHIGRVEQVLERISKMNPEFQIGGFHRF